MVVYLAEILKDQVSVAILSRGYKRKTVGYALAHPGITALEIGDEPMLFFTKFPELSIAVGERREEAIPQILQDRPETGVILLDDAFQHRSVVAGLNILLTDFSNLYTQDWFLPTGDLRDEKASAARAQIIVVTKCPPALSANEMGRIRKTLHPLPEQKIFFTSIQYGSPYHILSKQNFQIKESTEVLLVSGIANPLPLKKWLESNCTYEEILYSDHHIFTIDDLKDIRAKFSGMTAKEKIVLTTEKDAVRLIKFSAVLEDLPLYIMPISIQFLAEAESEFTSLVRDFIFSFRQKNI